MELLDDLQQDIWQKADPDQYPDFKPYTIIRANPKVKGELEMAVKQLTEEGDIPHIMARCVGIVGKGGRLKSMRNCELLVQEQEIVGINADGDCVVQTKCAK